MTRPTIEQVKDALAQVDYNDEDCGSVVVRTLAAEVRALREELAHAHDVVDEPNLLSPDTLDGPFPEK